MRQAISRYPLVAFFALAYALTWIPIALVLGTTHFGLLSSNSPVVAITSRLIGFGPAIAALIATAVVGGRTGLGQLLRRIVQWRVGIQWYLIVVFGVPTALVIGAIVLFHGAPLMASGGQWQRIATLYLPTLALAAITAGLGEETGWRGFALPRLQGKYGALIATLVVGVFWAMWHLPNVIFFQWGPQTLALFLIETLMDAFILTWVYNNTGGSLLLAILLHAAQNNSTHVLSTLMPRISSDQLYLVYILVDLAVVLVILGVTRGTLSYRRLRTSAVDGVRLGTHSATVVD